MGQAQEKMQHPQDIDLDHYKDMSVGEILRKTREYYGQSLEQVEYNLRIRASQLHALENGNLKDIPGRAYAIGFVRTYSDYLGLDGDKMVHLFKAQSVGKQAPRPVDFPIIPIEHKEPNIHLVIFGITGLILLVAYLSIFHAPTKKPEAIPPVPKALQEKTQAMLNPVVPDTPPEPIIKSNAMELLVKDESWVEIKTQDGKILVSQVLKPGDKFIVPEKQTLVLTTGNAGGLMVVKDGEEQGLMGATGDVKKNLVLNASEPEAILPALSEAE